MSLLLITALLFAPAQKVALDEDFESGVFPPVGWSELNNGNSMGWEDSGTGAAYHDDFVGLNDNYLVTPSMDLSTYGQVFMHARQGSNWTSYRDRNTLELSLDGGLTFNSIYREETIGDGAGQALELDLSTLGGNSDVILAFRYFGDFGNEWSIEDVLIDNQPYSPPLRWSQIPTSGRSASGFVEDFEALGGVVAPYLAVNMLDQLTRELDLRGFCNIGQLAPCQFKKGTYALEMGLAPGDPGLHFASNALIFGMAGAGTNRLWLEMQVMNHGEELDADDGVFLSADGVDWVPVLTDWDQATGGFLNIGRWQTVRVPLFGSTVDTKAQFYLAISQSDNRPYATYDGLTVDNIRVFSEPLLSASGIGAGQPGELLVRHLQEGASVALLYSTVGAGPTLSQFGLVDLSKPIHLIGNFTADVNGEVLAQGTVPPFMAGAEIWIQAVQTWLGMKLNSNLLNFIIP
jgi:opacity protein-like surface antigen